LGEKGKSPKETNEIQREGGSSFTNREKGEIREEEQEKNSSKASRKGVAIAGKQTGGKAAEGLPAARHRREEGWGPLLF